MNPFGKYRKRRPGLPRRQRDQRHQQGVRNAHIAAQPFQRRRIKPGPVGQKHQHLTRITRQFQLRGAGMPEELALMPAGRHRHGRGWHGRGRQIKARKQRKPQLRLRPGLRCQVGCQVGQTGPAADIGHDMQQHRGQGRAKAGPVCGVNDKAAVVAGISQSRQCHLEGKARYHLPVSPQAWQLPRERPGKAVAGGVRGAVHPGRRLRLGRKCRLYHPTIAVDHRGGDQAGMGNHLQSAPGIRRMALPQHLQHGVKAPPVIARRPCRHHVQMADPGNTGLPGAGIRHRHHPDPRARSHKTAALAACQRHLRTNLSAQ